MFRTTSSSCSSGQGELPHASKSALSRPMSTFFLPQQVLVRDEAGHARVLDFSRTLHKPHSTPCLCFSVSTVTNCNRLTSPAVSRGCLFCAASVFLRNRRKLILPLHLLLHPTQRGFLRYLVQDCHAPAASKTPEQRMARFLPSVTLVGQLNARALERQCGKIRRMVFVKAVTGFALLRRGAFV